MSNTRCEIRNTQYDIRNTKFSGEPQVSPEGQEKASRPEKIIIWKGVSYMYYPLYAIRYKIPEVAINSPPEGPSQFCILSFGFTLSTLNFKFPSCLQHPPNSLNLPKLSKSTKMDII